MPSVKHGLNRGNTQLTDKSAGNTSEKTANLDDDSVAKL